jgi:hypothetical protein
VGVTEPQLRRPSLARLGPWLTRARARHSESEGLRPPSRAASRGKGSFRAGVAYSPVNLYAAVYVAGLMRPRKLSTAIE